MGCFTFKSRRKEDRENKEKYLKNCAIKKDKLLAEFKKSNGALKFCSLCSFYKRTADVVSFGIGSRWKNVSIQKENDCAMFEFGSGIINYEYSSVMVD